MNSGDRWREFLLETSDRWQIWWEGMSTLVPRWRVDLQRSFSRLQPSTPDDKPEEERAGETLQAFPQVSSMSTEGNKVSKGTATPTLI
ncbi:hypothetical protein [Deinococcus sp. UYEF24]